MRLRQTLNEAWLFIASRNSAFQLFCADGIIPMWGGAPFAALAALTFSEQKA